ncbi:hypothetical protein ASC66_01170 [Leifsonia sp. Root4]|uniref:hypothetical protein n=1 Tax=Leifsonia sp. Root4 TaxID=1736525 RepID=UPI0007017B68|nr:hypothetical protein [Leifsonia sp. Root4]KQW07639.1 hypothetical protein ASC66_01170 [Leifsonia sp. Root4]
MNEIYRLRVGVNYSGSGSGGDWRYFEDIEKAKPDLLAAHLDMLSYSDRPTTTRTRLARIWRKNDEIYPHVTNVFAFERHTDAGWVPVTYTIVEPDVVIEAPDA